MMGTHDSLDVLFIKLYCKVARSFCIVLHTVGNAAFFHVFFYTVVIYRNHVARIFIHNIQIRVSAVLSCFKGNNRNRHIVYGCLIGQAGILSYFIVEILDTDLVAACFKGAKIVFAGKYRVIKVGSEGIKPAVIQCLDLGSDIFQKREIAHIFISIGKHKKTWMIAIGSGDGFCFLVEEASVYRIIATFQGANVFI